MKRGSSETAPDAAQSGRPGVPMEKTPAPLAGVHWAKPDQQPPQANVTMRVELKKLPPVFSTKQPPAGISGMIRRAAYRVPEHFPKHWALLLLADRVDVLEHRTGRMVRRTALAAGLLLAGWVGLRLLREA